MKIIADLQLHSKYSRAVSQKMNVEEIFSWAVKKGIGLVATGDWTHPMWIRELKAKLFENGSGFLQLKNSKSSSEPFSSSRQGGSTVGSSGDTRKASVARLSVEEQSPSRKGSFGASVEPLFLLATEISSIYSQGGKLRRIHNLVWAPSFKTVDKIIAELNKRGCNLGSDGRPIVGLTSREIAELVLSVDEKCLLIPAHAWTPWFSLYGSKSGFDSIEECFGEYSKYIYAIETGLSSDPVMNWRIADLESRAILSFSDAHSGPKIGREATVFELEELNYEALRKAIMDYRSSSEPFSSSKNSSGHFFSSRRGQESMGSSPELTIRKDSFGASNLDSNSKNKIACTFEFYPEEGKYHYTGHRLCGVKQTPDETKRMGTICHVCGKMLTVGVMHRVEELADREIKNEKFKIKNDEYGVRWIYHPENKKPPYVNLVPLLEILSEVYETASPTAKTFLEYDKLIEEFSGEFNVLLKADLDEIAKVSSEKLSQAVKRVRAGDIFIDPGFDGEFGKVKIWPDAHPPSVSVQTGEEEKKAREQMSLF